MCVLMFKHCLHKNVYSFGVRIWAYVDINTFPRFFTLYCKTIFFNLHMHIYNMQHSDLSNKYYLHTQCPSRHVPSDNLHRLHSDSCRDMMDDVGIIPVWQIQEPYTPDSKVHEANMGPIWGRQDPGGPHVGSMNFAIWAITVTPCTSFN